MTKIILIKGSTNSHKTGSAREFASTHLTGFTYIGHSPTIPVGVPSGIPPTGDFVAVGTCIKSGVVHQVGIASAGDTGSLIDRNLTYFSSLPNLDIIVICSKSSGSSVDRVLHHIYNPAGLFHGSLLHVTSTFRFAARSRRIAIDQTRVANDVLQLI